MGKIRILHIVEGFTTGGVEKLVLDLLTNHDKNAFDMAALSILPKSDLIFEKELENAGVKVFYLSRHYKRAQTIKKLYEINKIIKEYKPDIIHTHHFAIKDVMLISKLRRIPVRLHTVHVDGLLEANFTGSRLNGFIGKCLELFHGKALCNVESTIQKACSPGAYTSGYKNICFNMNSKVYGRIDIDDFRRKAYRGFRLFEIAYNCCGFLPVAISKSVKNSIEEIYGLSGVPVIYNGIVNEKFNNVMKKHDDSIKIIHVGRFEQGKNQELLIDAFKAVCEVCDNVKLTLVGDGIFRKLIIKKAAKMNLLKKIEFTGIRSDIQNLLGCSDIFVLSSMAESFGIVVVEAMAAELPIVSTDVGGISEIVQDNINGILVEPCNPHALAEAIIRLAKDRALREKFGKKGKELARQFDIKKTADMYGELYNKLISYQK
ncbi:MAG: glycosyltransferase family 4 protein [Caulobacteraceae bacterium]